MKFTFDLISSAVMRRGTSRSMSFIQEVGMNVKRKYLDIGGKLSAPVKIKESKTFEYVSVTIGNKKRELIRES